MPNVDGELAPDDVIRRGLRPECGKRLDIKSARHHAEDHWGIDPNSNHLSEEGRRRFNLILGFVGGKIGQPAMPETPSHRAGSAEQSVVEDTGGRYSLLRLGL